MAKQGDGWLIFVMNKAFEVWGFLCKLVADCGFNGGCCRLVVQH